MSGSTSARTWVATAASQATKEEWEHITGILDAVIEESKAKAAADNDQANAAR